MGTLIPKRVLDAGGVPAYAVYQTSDGQHIWVGHENGAALFRRGDGEVLWSYPRNGFQTPVIGVAAKDDFSVIYLCAREGDIRCLNLELKSEKWIETAAPRYLYKTGKPDFHSIAYASEAGLLVIGHLSQGLAAINENEDKPLWRMHPALGNATDADSWLVAIDANGQYLYVGSAMPNSNYLVALDPQTGLERTLRRHFDAKTKVTGVAALSDGGGVLVALGEKDSLLGYVGKLVLYDANLDEMIWEKSFDDTITALCADAKFSRAVISSGETGNLKVIDVTTGQILADDYALKSVIYQLSLVQGCYIAAADQNGKLALIQYRP
jgi:outer membrane protein assembly factor BamB